MKIYKLIYDHFFLKSQKKNSDPEIPVYLMLSIIQTNNFLTIINIILIVLNINNIYDIRKVAIIGPIIFCVINYYYFSKKGNGQIIIRDSTYNIGKYSFLLYLYIIMSLLLLIVTYYFYVEF